MSSLNSFDGVHDARDFEVVNFQNDAWDLSPLLKGRKTPRFAAEGKRLIQTVSRYREFYFLAVIIVDI